MGSDSTEIDARVERRLAAIDERAVRHRARPLAIRILGAVGGFALLAVAAPVAVVVPEVGVPLLIAALGILALEFAWAARALGRVLRTWGKFQRWYGSGSWLRKATFWFVALVVAAALVWLAMEAH